MKTDLHNSNYDWMERRSGYNNKGITEIQGCLKGPVYDNNHHFHW